ncbi:uncharacterized protein LOC112220243 isoform X2 [Oncorhynchus tshawytscha]|uniref:uncharacterized protein LOC112220243 isoform X2 n=1 Tax=Oncorhynchus tshawytscha TaxID=74940 RepID=UPI000D098AA4|nr:uncharacterized protein LOC112220243 isoform X2 [Oncorhynchus tshawytscha]
MGRDICYRCVSTEHEIKSCHAKIDPALDVCLNKLLHYRMRRKKRRGGIGRERYKRERVNAHMPRVSSVVRLVTCPGPAQTTPKDYTAAKQVTLGWLFNNMSTDHEEVHVPVKKLPPKQATVVIF